jgi:hypothetical protein
MIYVKMVLIKKLTSLTKGPAPTSKANALKVTIGIITRRTILTKMELVALVYVCVNKWAASRHSAFATSMDPDQPAHPRSLIRIHAVRLPTLLQVENIKTNNMVSDQTARMLVPKPLCWYWLHAAQI